MPTDAQPADARPTNAGPTTAGPTNAGPTNAGPTGAGPTDARPGPPRLILASASPARRRLLADAGLPAEVIVSGVDESIVDDDRPDALCLTLARLKAEAVAAQLRRDGAAGVLVLGCDSVLGFDNRILGKPADPAEATARWHAMRGKSGVLYTGHCLIHLPAPAGPTPATPGSDATAPGSGATTPGGDPVTVAAVAATTVHFADISDAEIDAYVRTGEPLAVAGAFTLDGRSSPFVESIEGDPGTVIGLSLPLLRRLLAELGIPITSLWATR